MPHRADVERYLLKWLFDHNGVIKEFGSRESVVAELADKFHLSEEQKMAYLETIYRKENRVKKAYLWHRLLFRAADSLANQGFVRRPTQALKLTSRRQWMLTEKGLDKALRIKKIPFSEKERLSIKSFEVERLARKIKKEIKPKNYSPISKKKKIRQSKRINIRNRAFRQAVIEAYDHKCAVCGLKISSPKKPYQWEVEAAHIIPHSSNGKDDIWNGLSLCRFHHWSFDVGWYSFDEKYCIVVFDQLSKLPEKMGKFWNYRVMDQLSRRRNNVQLPKQAKLWPDLSAIKWHRENIFGGSNGE